MGALDVLTVVNRDSVRSTLATGRQHHKAFLPL